MNYRGFRRFFAFILAGILFLNQTPLYVIAQESKMHERQNNEYQDAVTFENGDGPYAISTKEELDAIRTNLGGEYYLTADINFTAADFAEGGLFYNDGAKWIPIGTSSFPFTGVFDGNGFSISGLEVNIDNSGNIYGGLFGYVRSSSSENGIFDLGMESCNIYVSNHVEDCYAGSVAGYCEVGRIEGCYDDAWMENRWPNMIVTE